MPEKIGTQTKDAAKPITHINMRPLKQFAYENLPKSPLRKVLLIEADVLDVHTFLARLPLWLNLLRTLDI